MFQVRFHGRGGQGVVTAAELLAEAAFREGRHAQAFPSFGSERMGAPVMSFCRIDDQPIRTHEPVSEADALIIQDPTLLHQAELFAGLGREGHMLINSTKSFDELGLDEFVKGFHRDRLLVVPASSLTLTHLGRPLPGAPMLGGFAALTGGGQPGGGTGRHQRQVRRRGGRGKRRRGPGRIRFRRRRAAGADRCLSRSRAPARWPRRWPCAALR
jgi:pyruvate ferredoxin oxidoreductase gamma subunit